MTIALILIIAAAGAAGTAYALPLGGRVGRAAALGGVLGLLLIAGLAAAGTGSVAPAPGLDVSIPEGSALAGSLLPGAYLRLVVTLVASMGALLAVMAWLLGGFSELDGLLPAMLVAAGGTTVALAASQPMVAAAGAAGTGLAAIPLVLARRRPGRAFPALSELRASLMTGVVVAAAAVVTQVVTRIVSADPSAVLPENASPAAATAGLAGLGLGLVVAVRFGAVPFHLRLARLADVTQPIGLPVVAAWIPLPLTVAALAVANGLLAPLAVPLDAERAALVILALVGLGGAALAAFITDDLRHGVAYLIAADGAFAVVALAALDPITWGPARAWLVVVLVSKTALGAWSAVVEDRFATKAIPELRGWARRAPVLAVALVIVAVATFGLPGWVSFEVRAMLPQAAVADPWATLLMVAGFLTLPTYVRVLQLGLGRPAANVHRAEPEHFRPNFGTRVQATGGRLGRARRDNPGQAAGRGVDAVLDAVGPAGDVTPDPGQGVETSMAVGSMRPRSAGSAADRTRAGLRAAAQRGRAVVPSAAGLRRGRTELLSAAVLLLALLSAVVAYGGLDVNRAASDTGGGPPVGLEGN